MPLLTLGGRGEDSGDVPEAIDPTATSARSELEITVMFRPGAEPITWTLTCDPPGGTHPNPAGACAAIEAARHPLLPDAENDDEGTLTVITTRASLAAHDVTALVGINVVHARYAARAPR